MSGEVKFLNRNNPTLDQSEAKMIALDSSDHRGLVSTFMVTPKPLPKFLAVNKRFFTVGETITATVNEQTEQEKVVLLKEGIEPKILNTQSKLKKSSTANFDTKSLEPGSYQVALLENNNITAIQNIHLQVTDAKFNFTSNKKSYAVGEPVVITTNNEPGMRWSSIAIFNHDRSFHMYEYTSHGYGKHGYTETGTLTPNINNQIDGQHLV